MMEELDTLSRQTDGMNRPKDVQADLVDNKVGPPTNLSTTGPTDMARPEISPSNDTNASTGDNIPSDGSSELGPSSAGEKPWYLGYDFEEGKEIVFTKDGDVEGGTLSALIAYCTLHD